MLVRYKGGDFVSIVTKYKKFVWFIYDEVQTIPNNPLTLKPTWIKSFGPIVEFQEIFPEMVFVESMIDEVKEEVFELGYNLNLDSTEGGLWDGNNDHFRPIIIGFDKGWKKVDSRYKCYCLETLSEILFEIYPNNFIDYLNQPV
jgi:hypothetical protein